MHSPNLASKDLLHGKGRGAVSAVSVTEDGLIFVHMMGKDSINGQWASFAVPMTLSEFRRLSETVENSYEEEAQQRIC